MGVNLQSIPHPINHLIHQCLTGPLFPSNLKVLRLGRQLLCRPDTLTEQVNTLMAPHLNTNVSPHQVSDGYIRLVLLLDVVVVVDVVDVPPRRRLVVDVVDVSSVL